MKLSINMSQVHLSLRELKNQIPLVSIRLSTVQREFVQVILKEISADKIDTKFFLNCFASL